MTQTARRRPATPRRDGWQLGRLWGVPVVLARSWFLIAAVITVFFGQVVGRANPTLGAAAYAVAFGFAVLLLLSVLVHELAHAVVARATGTPATRIVLNLWGGHTQFEDEAATPWRSSLIAVVGPLANGVLAGLAFALLPTVDPRGIPGLLLYALAYTNAFVAAFNLVPGLPLDGGRMLEALVWKVSGDRLTGMVVAGWVGRAFAVLVVGWLVLRPLVSGAPPDLVMIVWAAVIGAFLWQGAGAAITSARTRRRIAVTTARQLVDPAVGVPAGATVEQALAAAGASGATEIVLIGPDGRPVALLDAAAAESVPVARRAVAPAAAAARALPPEAVFDVGLGGRALIDALTPLPGHEWVAVDGGGEVVGVLRSSAVVAAVLRRRA